MTHQNTLSRVAVLLIGTLMAVLLLLATSVGAEGTPQAFSEYRVQSGDTLWGIAERIAEPGEDIRAVIHDLRQTNDLPNSVIVVGQTLLVP